MDGNGKRMIYYEHVIIPSVMEELLNTHDCKNISISGLKADSTVDGPGVRYVVWTQGCDANCQGCHNPETHHIPTFPRVHTVQEILDDISKNKSVISGLTISGGEPFLQPLAIYNLITLFKNEYPDKSVIIYTGKLIEDLWASDDAAVFMLATKADFIIDGPYDYKSPVSPKDNRRFIGSLNQRVIDVKSSDAINGIIVELEDL